MAEIENYCCTRCPLMCDDLTLTTDNDSVVKADRACPIARPWLLSLEPIRHEIAEIEGRRSSWSEAVEYSADILRRAHSPLVFGLSRCNIDSQRTAVRLADAIGATLDVECSPGQHACIAALQSVGQSGCSLGEIQQRCDLVIFWRADPVRTHPRLLERFLSEPGKRLIVVGDAPSETSRATGDLLTIDRISDLPSLAALRLLIAGQPTAADAAVRQLAAAISNSRCGAILFDPAIGEGLAGTAIVKSMFQLVADLNATRRFYALPLGSAPNLSGAESVLGWQTGYPGSVNFGTRFPRHRLGEFTAGDMLRRGEVDACVIVGGAAIAALPDDARERLRSIPSIVIDSETAAPEFAATVRFQTARAGVHSTGTAFRVDHVPLPLKPVFPSTIGTEAAVLAAIADRFAAQEIRDSAAQRRGT